MAAQTVIPLQILKRDRAMAKKKAAAGIDATACPCGSAVAYSACCGRFIDDFLHIPAPDAERLMRSRYTAFVLERAPYLLATWHASQRPPSLDFDPQCRWLGLEVKDFQAHDGTHAEVEFVARYKVQGRAVRLHERSRFVQENGRWFYVDGDQF